MQASEHLLQDIQHLLRAPLPNLVYRRLAAEHPRFLATAWSLSRDAAESTWMIEAAGAVTLASQPSAPAATLDTPMGAIDVLDAFGRMNPPNLVLLHAWLAALRGTPPTGIAPLTPRTDPAPAPLPPMLAEDADSLFAQVKETLGQLPTVWRLLAHWPDYARAAWHLTQEARSTPAFATTIHRVVAAAAEQAAAFPDSLSPLAATLDRAESATLEPLLVEFAHHFIPPVIADLALLRASARTSQEKRP